MRNQTPDHGILLVTRRRQSDATDAKLKRDDVAGIAVHITARIAGGATAWETMVSSAVGDPVAGSGLTFENCGINSLTGLPEALHFQHIRHAS
jgi:hypothetical protein